MAACLMRQMWQQTGMAVGNEPPGVVMHVVTGAAKLVCSMVCCCYFCALTMIWCSMIQHTMLLVHMQHLPMRLLNLWMDDKRGQAVAETLYPCGTMLGVV